MRPRETASDFGALSTVTLFITLTILFCLVPVFARAEAPPAPTARAPDSAWRALPLIKDGAVDPSWSLLGYGKFVVDDGALRTDPDERGMGLLVYTREKLGDCQLRIVYKTKDAKCNSGIYVRMEEEVLNRFKDKAAPAKRDANGKLPKAELQKFMDASEKEQGAWWAVHHGYEVQICDTGDPFHRTGAIYSLAKAAELPKRDPGEWRTMVITLAKDVVTVEVDGKRITRFDPAGKDVPQERKWTEPKREPKRPQSGYIGLQVHDPGDLVWFKELSVKPLEKDQK